MIIAIDPGDGMIISNEIIQAKKQPDIKEFFEFVTKHKEYLYVIEQLALRPTDLITKVKGKTVLNPAAWNKVKMLQRYSNMLSVFKIVGVKYIEVMPTVWQKDYNVKEKDYRNRKARFKNIAKSLFSQHNVFLWNSDAFLIYEFIRKKQMYDPFWITEKLANRK